MQCSGQPFLSMIHRVIFRIRTGIHRYYSSSSSLPRRSLLLPGVLSASLISYTLGSISPPQSLTLLFPRPAPPPPDPSDPASVAYTQNLEESLQSLPLIQKLRTQPDAEEWYETRPYQNFPEERRVNHLTAGVLRGPGRFTIRPLVRSRKDEKESIVFLHVGRALCGYDGVVHGGLLATVLDESLGRTAIINLPDKVGVTANLDLKYKAPTRADQFIVIKTKLDGIQGRKAFVSGRVEDLQGTLLVEATATFIQPKYAKLLNSSSLRKAWGEPVQPDKSGMERLK
ncbi:HotDog domain containing protein [Amanita muscaria]